MPLKMGIYGPYEMPWDYHGVWYLAPSLLLIWSYRSAPGLTWRDLELLLIVSFGPATS